MLFHPHTTSACLRCYFCALSDSQLSCTYVATGVLSTDELRRLWQPEERRAAELTHALTLTEGIPMLMTMLSLEKVER